MDGSEATAGDHDDAEIDLTSLTLGWLCLGLTSAVLIDPHADMLALLDRHCLGLDADIAILPTAIGYLAHAHGIVAYTLACRAASPTPRGDRGLH